MDLLGRLRDGLSKTRTRILSTVGIRPQGLDDAFMGGLEDALLGSDIGIDRTSALLGALTARIRAGDIRTPQAAYSALKGLLVEGVRSASFSPGAHRPWVVLVAGVNGVGKTTTIGKLAQQCRCAGYRTMLGAADTFRAGAIEQLRIWAQRTGAEIVAQKEGSDPASVAFDALEAAKARGIDVLLLDTAGRLHSKSNLMNEIDKVARVLGKALPGAPHETILVVDATTGQNAIRQAEAFHRALGLTGLVVTKLDGTAKGGALLNIARTLSLPVVKVGVGEGPDDLQDFDPVRFVDAMLGDIE